MPSYEVPRVCCPDCGRDLDRATGSGRAPKAGDFTVCLGCTAWLRFTAELTLRRCDDVELAELPVDVRDELEETKFEHWGTLPTGEYVQFEQGPNKIASVAPARRMLVTIGTRVVVDAVWVAEEFADSVRHALRTVFQR